MGKNLITSKRPPNLIETDRGKEFFSKLSIDLLNKNNIRRYSRYTSLGVAFAKRLTCSIRDSLEKPLSERRDATWIDILPRKTKQYINIYLSSNTLTEKQAS